ncbi:MAG: hypothetical protein AUJ85_04715 [Elusimicrobia bacterium CG1_02_37_114]|nr:MAG: hypothetical protein AUJ85_04715 [Elusimicrobia bacterium CG1_02_37_114]
MNSNNLKEKIMETLHKVIDPETGIDVVSMGLIKKLEVTDDEKVELIFSPSMPTCPLGFKLAFDIRNAISQVEGVRQIDMQVTDFIYADKLNQILSEVDRTL